MSKKEKCKKGPQKGSKKAKATVFCIEEEGGGGEG